MQFLYSALSSNELRVLYMLLLPVITHSKWKTHLLADLLYTFVFDLSARSLSNKWEIHSLFRCLWPWNGWNGRIPIQWTSMPMTVLDHGQSTTRNTGLSGESREIQGRNPVQKTRLLYYLWSRLVQNRTLHQIEPSVARGQRSQETSEVTVAMVILGVVIVTMLRTSIVRLKIFLRRSLENKF